MKTAFLAAGLALISQQAQALSCMRPEAVDTYRTLAAAPESYSVLLGTLAGQQTGIEGLLKEQRSVNHIAINPMLPEIDRPADPSFTYTLTFTGHALTSDGFNAPTTAPINVTVECLGIYCGGVPVDQTVMIFVEQRDTGMHLVEGPCPFAVFLDPLPETITQIENCMKTGACGT